jgi:hypothetical protein
MVVPLEVGDRRRPGRRSDAPCTAVVGGTLARGWRSRLTVRACAGERGPVELSTDSRSRRISRSLVPAPRRTRSERRRTHTRPLSGRGASRTVPTGVGRGDHPGDGDAPVAVTRGLRLAVEIGDHRPVEKIGELALASPRSVTYTPASSDCWFAPGSSSDSRPNWGNSTSTKALLRGRPSTRRSSPNGGSAVRLTGGVKERLSTTPQSP